MSKIQNKSVEIGIRNAEEKESVINPFPSGDKTYTLKRMKSLFQKAFLFMMSLSPLALRVYAFQDGYGLN